MRSWSRSLALLTGLVLTVSGCSALGGSGGPVAQNVVGGLCEHSVANAAITPDAAARTVTLDQAIRTCRSLEQWAAAVETYGGDAIRPDATAYLAARCADPSAAVDGYMLCGLFAASLVTPAPEPTRKPARKATRKAPRTSKPAR